MGCRVGQSGGTAWMLSALRCWKSPRRRHGVGKEAARGSRHAQKGCPSEGHCREHRLEETHVSQQLQGPSKGHFNPLGHQAARVRVG